MHELSQEDRDVLAELHRLAKSGGLTDEDREALRELVEAARSEPDDLVASDLEQREC